MIFTFYSFHPSPFAGNICEFPFLSDKYGENVNICCNHVLILFEYFEAVSRNVLDSEQRNRLPGPPKTTSYVVGTNLQSSPVARRVKYSSSKTEARSPYLVFQGIDETGRITDTRRHTYDPITFRMQITPSNHELKQRYPAISPSSILFDPIYPQPLTHHFPHSSLSVPARLFLSSFDDIRYPRNKP